MITNEKFQIEVMISLIASVVVISTLLLIIYRKKYGRFNQLIEKFPGPTTLPLVGNGLMFLGNTQDIFNAFEKMKEYPTPSRIWLGPTACFLFVWKPDHLKIVMTHAQTLDKGPLQRKIGEKWIGNALLFAPVPIWRQHRKIVTQAFSQKILDSFMPIFMEQSKILVKCLEKEAVTEKEFDLWNYISRATLDLICGTAMGTKMNSQTQDSGYLNAAVSQSEIVIARGFHPWLHPDILFKCTPMYRKQCRNLKIMHQFETNVIEEKKRLQMHRRMSIQLGIPVGFGKNKKGKAFLDFLIDLTENDPDWTVEDLRDEVSVFTVAGYETTATTVCFTMMALAFHQEVQTKVYDELLGIFGESNRNITVEDLNQMKYLEMVIKESLRVYNTAPYIIRYCTEDLSLDDKIIPAGTHIIIALRWLHHNPEIWPNPLKFIPERFEPDQVAQRHPYAYLPFSGGPRNCIGYKYAMMSMKSMLSTVLRSYRITTNMKAEEIKFKLEVTAKSVDGYFVKLQKRA